jgi:methyl-accepting chemotaxis protein
MSGFNTNLFTNGSIGSATDVVATLGQINGLYGTTISQVQASGAGTGSSGDFNSLTSTGFSNYFIFNGGTDRLLRTKDISTLLSTTITISFNYITGNGVNGGNAAETGETFYLEFLNNAGARITRYTIHNGGAFYAGGTNFTAFQHTLQTIDKTATYVRWIQELTSTGNFDHYAINNIVFASSTLIPDPVGLFIKGPDLNTRSSVVCFGDNGTGVYHGGMTINYDSLDNKLQFGGDANDDGSIDASSAITILNLNKYVGILKDTPVYPLDVVGDIQTSTTIRTPRIDFGDGTNLTTALGIATNTTDIATNTTNIATNTTNIATNTTDIATNTTDIATNTTNIATNTTDIATNTTNIATNAGNIATNTTNIATNTTNIATNTTDIATNAGNIATNTTNIATNTTNIATNTTNIATNTTNIATNAGNIATNTTNIATNTTNIATNTTNIATNTTDIATNTTDIATNTTNIATNTTNIATNTADIATNTTNIATNTTNIATNTTNIATNTTNIATNTSDLVALNNNISTTHPSYIEFAKDLKLPNGDIISSVYDDTDVRTLLSTSAGTGLTWNATNNQFDNEDTLPNGAYMTSRNDNVDRLLFYNNGNTVINTPDTQHIVFKINNIKKLQVSPYQTENSTVFKTPELQFPDGSSMTTAPQIPSYLFAPSIWKYSLNSITNVNYIYSGSSNNYPAIFSGTGHVLLNLNAPLIINSANELKITIAGYYQIHISFRFRNNQGNNAIRASIQNFLEINGSFGLDRVATNYMRYTGNAECACTNQACLVEYFNVNDLVRIGFMNFKE